ncbi:META domain-containing protein [Streptomyces sp. CC219B]|uniref:META domain-containing protein n=1 Tax=Streptomyces sp. CC219B TaxID=3044574 RepID=UPI0024A90CAF|nr:META domain-containing protein [Streptomyces sp. CC219B]
MSVTCAVLAAAGLSLASASAATPRQVADADLGGVPWVAESITADGERYPAPEGVGLRFDTEAGVVTAHDGCNRLAGLAEADPAAGTVTFGEGMMSTAIACYGREFQQRFVASLHGTVRAQVTSGTLTLTGADGSVLVLRAGGPGEDYAGSAPPGLATSLR